MSYRQKGKQSYSISRRRQLPSLNTSFRPIWDKGLGEALIQIEKLRNEGWIVDSERGALTQSQADEFVKRVEKSGFETTRIPVARWEEDLAQFVAYKPKQGESIESSIPPEAQPEPKKSREASEVDPIERFQMMFWPRGSPDLPDEGTLMSPGRDMAVVNHNASPTHSLSKLASETISQATVRGLLDYDKLVKALKAKKDKVKFKTGEHFSLDKMKRSVKVLGKGEAYFASTKPLAVKNKRGDVFLIAPLEGVPDNNPGSIDFDELSSL